MKNSNSKLKYPSLRDLLAGSFYQCWEEYDSRPPSEILKEAISGITRENKIKAVSEIDLILSSLKDNSELENIIGYDIGCNYSSEDDGIPYIDWLETIKENLLFSLSVDDCPVHR